LCYAALAIAASFSSSGASVVAFDINERLLAELSLAVTGGKMKREAGHRLAAKIASVRVVGGRATRVA
jgi:hypothetical protein